jgi:localization factor PodJL
MTYDDECDWRQQERPSWRREPQQRVAGDRLARGRPAPRHLAERPDDRAAGERFAAAPTFRDGASGVTEISAMVDRIITQLDAVDRGRRSDAPSPPPERRAPSPPRLPRRDILAEEPVPPAGSFIEALRQRLRTEEPREQGPREQGPREREPLAEAAKRPPSGAAAARPATPPTDTIDRHFRVLAERVDLLRQRTDDNLGAVRDDVARLSEAVLARPVASLDPDDRAALDALARRLDRAADTGPETLDRLDILRDDLARLSEAMTARPSATLDPGDRAALDDIARTVRHVGRAAPEALERIDAVQEDLTTLGRMLRELDLDKRLLALEVGQDAVIERIGTVAAQSGPSPAIDGLRRRIDWIAERLDRPPANDAMATIEARIVRLAGDVQRLVEAPARGGAGADGALARDVAAMRAELAELTRGGIVSQFDEIGSALARLAGEVKTAARSAGAETAPMVADLVRRIERLDRRLDALPAGHERDDRLQQIERMIAALDRRPADPRPATPPASERRDAARPQPLPVETAAPATPPRSETVEVADGRPPAPSRTSRLIAAARRAVEHPILGRSGDATDAVAIRPAETPPVVREPATRPRTLAAPATATVVAFEPRQPMEMEADLDGLPDAPGEGDATLDDRTAGLSGRRLLLLAAAVIGLIGGAYGFASEPLRVLLLTLSGSETSATVSTAVPTIADPATTGSITRATDPSPFSAGTSTAGGGAAVPSAASIPATVGSPGLREAAAGGDPRAALEVAVSLIDGIGVKRDPAAAVPWLMLAADRGLALAEFRLGTLYERGIGVARNRDTAKVWYDRAAGRGHVKAMHNLAVLLAEAGEGRDVARAVGWFEKAARHGLVDSQFNLAVLYVRGLGVAEDQLAAYRWFALAARQGDQEARVRRDELGKDLAPADRAAADLAIAGWTPLPADAAVNEGPPLPQAWTGASAPPKG